MRVIITGSPGSGKSTASELLARRMGLSLIRIKDVAEAEGLVGKGGEVDIGRLARSLSFLRGRDGYVVEGHLACEMRLPADFLFILRCRPDELRRRLKRRRYSKRKTEENIMAEMLDYCLQRAEATYAIKPLQIETAGRSAIQTAAEMEKAIKRNKKKIDEPDYSKSLARYLAEGMSS
ncbi:MAG: AAA family ATPase [Candidatus Micrarchaeia archaeon]